MKFEAHDKGERNYIMQILCEATQSTAVPVQVCAFECLVRIMSLYYEKMDFYMERALFGVSHSTTVTIRMLISSSQSWGCGIRKKASRYRRSSSGALRVTRRLIWLWRRKRCVTTKAHILTSGNRIWRNPRG